MVKETDDSWICDKCKEEVSETDKFCKNCGESIDSETEITWMCDKCEEEVSETDKFCKNCGNSVSEKMLDDPTEKKERKRKSNNNPDLLIIILILAVVAVVYSNVNGLFDSQSSNIISVPSEVGPTYQPVYTPEPYGNLLIDNISRDLDILHDNGWQELYERNEFDCSRMSTYMWDYIRTKYKIPPKILISNEREHAWIALRVIDVGDTDRYLQWKIKGIDYYFLESTYPNIVKNIPNYNMGDNIYASSIDFYTTIFYLADDPQEANVIAGKWSQEFRLTKSDLDKLNTFNH